MTLCAPPPQEAPLDLDLVRWIRQSYREALEEGIARPLPAQWVWIVEGID